MFADQGAAKLYALLVGAVLILLGLLGFESNALVGDPSAGPVFVTGTIHNLIFLLSGSLAIYVAFGLDREQQAWGVVGLGLFYAIVFLGTVFDGDLFGILNFPTNAPDHALHLALAVVGLGVGWYALTGGGVRRLTAR